MIKIFGCWLDKVCYLINRKCKKTFTKLGLAPLGLAPLGPGLAIRPGPLSSCATGPRVMLLKQRKKGCEWTCFIG